VSSDPLHSRPRLDAVHATGLLDTAAEESFDQLTRLARDLLRSPFAFVTLVDDRRSFWKSRAGVEPEGPRQNTLEESFCQYVVASGEPLVLPDAREDPLTRDNPSIAAMGVVAWAGYPVKARDGHVLGTFCVVDTVPREWTPGDLRVLETLAAVASTEVALRVTATEADRARQAADLARETTERVAGRLALLARTGELLVAGLDVDDLVARIGELLCTALNCSATVFLAGADGRLRGVFAWHADADVRIPLQASLRSRRPGRADSWGAGRVAATGRAETVDLDDHVLGQAPPDVAELLRTTSGTSAMVLPLLAGDRVLGAAELVRHRGLPFSDGEMDVTRDVVNRAALALENATLFAEQREFSVRLQHAMLTPPPEPDHLHVAVRYLPAATANELGGDWYDAFLQKDGSTVLVVGDVAGHDGAAAAAMGQLRALLRAIAYDSDSAPAEILTRTDVAMRGLLVDAPTTAVVARIEQGRHERGTRTLRWANAGHLPPVLRRCDGTVTVLDEGAPELLLGIRPEVRRTDRTVELTAGDTLLLYTDGLIERRGVHLSDSLTRLADVMRHHGDLPLEELCDVLLARMPPRPQADDIALVAVRTHAEDGPRPAD
jgi:serine phosphatase RsbU (regulator of sigma subunit)